MKILMVIERYLPIWGGAENQLIQLVENLVQKDFHVTVVTRRWKKEFHKFEDANGVEIYRIGVPGDGAWGQLVFIFSLVLFVFKKRKFFDLYHSHGAVKMGAISAVLARILKKKNISKIATAGHVGLLAQSVSGRAIIKCFKLSDAVIAMTDEIEREMKSVEVKSSKIVRITNGVDCRRFRKLDADSREQLRKNLAFDREDRLFLFAGRLVYRKGLDILIDAWDGIVKQNSKNKLLIVGSGIGQDDSVEQKMKNLVAERKLPGVFFMGETDMPEKYLAIADFFVFPSRQEGFPNALLEAMACGIPVIASNIGGVVDLIADGQNGLLFENERPEALAQRISYLAGDRKLQKVIGDNARKTVREMYSFRKISNDYICLYNRLV